MPTLAVPQDVADRWKPLTDAQQNLAWVLIGDVSGIIRLRHSDIDARIIAGTPPADVVAGVVARSVLRVMRNPDGKISESIDDYTYRRADAVADGSLYVSTDDWLLLDPVASATRVRSVRLVAYGDV